VIGKPVYALRRKSDGKWYRGQGYWGVRPRTWLSAGPIKNSIRQCGLDVSDLEFVTLCLTEMSTEPCEPWSARQRERDIASKRKRLDKIERELRECEEAIKNCPASFRGGFTYAASDAKRQADRLRRELASLQGAR
jgi:hypothetical protein